MERGSREAVMMKRVVELAAVVSLAGLIAGPGVEADEGQGGKAPKEAGTGGPAKKKAASPKRGLDLDKLRLPPAGYARKLEVASDPQESAGVRASVVVVPDAFRYRMALGFEEIRKASYGAVELEKKLKELHARNRKNKGKALYILSLSSDGGKNHHFVQSALKEHVLLRGKTKRTIVPAREEPKPEFAGWRVFEQKANQRNMLEKKLSGFTKLTFEFTADRKEGDREPLTLSVQNLVRVTDRRDEQKTDYRAFEGINASLKQISSSDWKSQTVPAITFKLYPGRWNVPDPPAGFEELLRMLEGG
jgi:hypothetical protein